MATSGRTLTRDAPVYVACRGHVVASFSRGCTYVACRGHVVASFSRGCPSVRRLPRSCCRELQPGMPQCTSLAEVVLSRASTGDAPVYVIWKCSSWEDDVRDGLGVNDECECPNLHC
ncbi:hypothetical protein CDL15_Pgr002571 [Punica granatum]|uniref:Uncharacterized protein n=1 Tax=Punica granatum TaxID=22663 RepID=A0A218X632_PUNGR|nr:hypothetical protein CDL15_Pgr002571 [Punica granatum]